MNTPRTDSLDRYLQTLMPSERYAPMRLHAERLETELTALQAKSSALLAKLELDGHEPNYVRKAIVEFHLNS